jgi:hypothetical protein
MSPHITIFNAIFLDSVTLTDKPDAGARGLLRPVRPEIYPWFPCRWTGGAYGSLCWIYVKVQHVQVQVQVQKESIKCAILKRKRGRRQRGKLKVP